MEHGAGGGAVQAGGREGVVWPPRDAGVAHGCKSSNNYELAAFKF